MATVKQIIERAYTKVNGEYEPLTEGSDDFKTYLAVMNDALDGWAHTPYVKWQSLFDANYTLPDQVEEGKLVYEFADSGEVSVANTPFDAVYFINDSGEVVDKYKMTDQAFFDAATNTKLCALFSDGLHLKAVNDNIVGTTIRLPAYVMPPTYTSGSQNVVVDSVKWLTTTMAATIADSSPVPFIARNAEKYAKESAYFMKEMRDNNRHLQHLTTKRVTGRANMSLSQAIDAGIGISTVNSDMDSVDGGLF